ncbi:hypothetical protein bcgnr5369_68490 [Bacillus cereus]
MYNKHVIIPFLLLVLGVKRVFANSLDRTQLQEGKNTIHIVATDAAGNTSNLTVNLEVK